MKTAVTIPILFLLTACSGEGATLVFYVVVQPAKTANFLESITAIAKENGMETASGKAFVDTADVMAVIEGTSLSQHLWIQSNLMSGHEDPKLCGIYSEAHSDPAQFVVMTEPRLFGSKTGARELGMRVFSRLKNLGYPVRTTPAVCGLAVLSEHP